MVKYTITSEFNCKEPMLGECSSILPWQEATQNPRYRTAQLFSLMKAYIAGSYRQISIQKSKSWQVNASFSINSDIMFTILFAKFRGFCHSTFLNQIKQKHTTAAVYNNNNNTILIIMMIMSNFQDNYIRVRIIWFHIILHSIHGYIQKMVTI